MSATVFALVLLGAIFHASWNTLVKGSGDKFVTALAISLAAAIGAALILPFIAQPAAASWPFIAVSAGLQTLYYSLVAAAYGRIDMSQAYPVMRGGAPLIVAGAMALFFAEHLPALGWAGVALISCGILALTMTGRSGPQIAGQRAGLGFALLNACVIAAYTVNDGLGVRLSGAPVGYTLWVALATAPPILALALFRRGPTVLAQTARRWRDGLLGGAGTTLSYGIALWAMTLAPIAMVAALRETSILFAIALSAFFLGEKITPARLASVALLCLGAALLRLA